MMVPCALVLSKEEGSWKSVVETMLEILKSVEVEKDAVEELMTKSVVLE